MKKKVAKIKDVRKCGHNDGCCEPPHELFQMSMNTEFTGPYASLPFSVPAGKCLIVESASVLTKLPSGQRAYVQLYGNATGSVISTFRSSTRERSTAARSGPR